MDYLKLVPKLVHILPTTIEETDCFWLKVIVNLITTKEQDKVVLIMLLEIISTILTAVSVRQMVIGDEKEVYNVFIRELIIQAYESRQGTPKIAIIFDLLLVIFGVSLSAELDEYGTAKINNEVITNFYTETAGCEGFKTTLIRNFLTNQDVHQQLINSIAEFIKLLSTSNNLTLLQSELNGLIDKECSTIVGKLTDPASLVSDIINKTKILSTFSPILLFWKKALSYALAKGVYNYFGNKISSVFRGTKKTGEIGGSRRKTRKHYRRK